MADGKGLERLMKRSDLTQDIKKLMGPEDQAFYSDQPIVKAGLAHAEPKISPLERDHHATFSNWLMLNGFAFRHSRTDKATRETVGAPDFSVYERRSAVHSRLTKALLMEFKLPGNKMSAVQEQWAANCGGIVHIVASADEAIRLVRHELSAA